MIVGQPFNGRMSVVNARIEQDIDINAAKADDPIKEPCQRPQMINGVEALAENEVEKTFQPKNGYPHPAFYGSQQSVILAYWGTCPAVRTLVIAHFYRSAAFATP